MGTTYSSSDSPSPPPARRRSAPYSYVPSPKRKSPSPPPKRKSPSPPLQSPRRRIPTRQECQKCLSQLKGNKIYSKADFRRWALQHHPDKGGNTAVFQDVLGCKELIIDHRDCGGLAKPASPAPRKASPPRKPASPVPRKASPPRKPASPSSICKCKYKTGAKKNQRCTAKAKPNSVYCGRHVNCSNPIV